MYKKSHHVLGKHLANIYFPQLPDRYCRAFVTGCVQPDKNPTTYLKGSLRRKWLSGHNFTNSRRYMRRLICRLGRKGRWHLWDYYTLGKLLHYTADAFTGAHNPQFRGNLTEHRAYEKKLHNHILSQLSHPHHDHLSQKKELMESLCAYHKKYSRLPMLPATDAAFCIAASHMVMRELTAPTGKTEQFPAFSSV